ncbi:MAG: hypothetical protein ACE5DI_01935, partial [Candidatus Micrarchaeia archaeon]
MRGYLRAATKALLNLQDVYFLERNTMDELSQQIRQSKTAQTKKRTGKTRDHYEKQKSQTYAYFRVKQDELAKIKSGQFTIYDFISDSFSFSHRKKELTIQVLEALKEKPMTFQELATHLNAKKST